MIGHRVAALSLCRFAASCVPEPSDSFKVADWLLQPMETWRPGPLIEVVGVEICVE